MMNLTDEILNRYLDGELSETESEDVQKILLSDENAKKRFNALKLVHDKLLIMEEEKVLAGFTEKVVSQLGKKYKVPAHQKWFFISIVVFISSLSLLALGYVIGEILASVPSYQESAVPVETIDRLSEGLIVQLKSLFSGKNLSIIGSIISLGIMISGYFFFEHQKKTKIIVSS
jgi:anti-sigma factor RsiW